MGETQEMPKVGDTWEQASVRYTIHGVMPALTDVDGRRFVTCKDGDEEPNRGGSNYRHFGPGCCWISERVLKESGRLISRAPTEAERPVAEVDWERWLPTKVIHPREDTDAADAAIRRAARPGQVWACRWGKEDWQARLWRCDENDTDTVLAGDSAGKTYSRGDGGIRLRYRHAILVADVGCTPTPPEVLYGTPPTPAKPVEPPSVFNMQHVWRMPQAPTATNPGNPLPPPDPYAEHREKLRRCGPEGGGENGIWGRVFPPARPAPWVCAVSDEDCLGVDVTP